MMKNKVRDKLLRFIHTLIDVLMCIVALLWTAIDPGLLEKVFFRRMACPVPYRHNYGAVCLPGMFI